MSGVSDVNGDGRGDVVIGAFSEDPGASPNEAGRAYIFDGSTGALLQTLVSPNEEDLGYFGQSVSGISDINGDGRGDVVIGAYFEDPGASPSDAGGGLTSSTAQPRALLRTLVSPNEETSGRFGGYVSGVSDVNGDGRGDVVIGAYLEDPGASPSDAGRAYIFDGSTGALLRTLVSPNEETTGRFWSSVVRGFGRQRRRTRGCRNWSRLRRSRRESFRCGEGLHLRRLDRRTPSNVGVPQRGDFGPIWNLGVRGFGRQRRRPRGCRHWRPSGRSGRESLRRGEGLHL